MPTILIGLATTIGPFSEKNYIQNVQHVYSYTIIQGNSLIKYSLSMYRRLNTSGTVFLSFFFGCIQNHEDQNLSDGEAGGEFRGRRTGPRPPFRTRMEIWECRPPPPPSIWPSTGMSICSYVIQSFGRCSFPPFCASLCGSGTRFSPVSRTSSGTWRSRCASVWRGTCWR